MLLQEKGVGTMTAITISREFASEGDAVAERVARLLGYHLVGKEVISDVLAQYGFVEFDKEYDALPGFWEKFSAQRADKREQTLRLVNNTIRALAFHGNVVIVGRSGFAVLGGLADVLHVRLQAPLAKRIEHFAEQNNLTVDEASVIVKENDRLRAVFVEESCGVSWHAMEAFDLVINTAAVSQDLAVAWIFAAAKERNVHLSSETPSTRSMAPDPVLLDTVAERLGCKTIH